MAYCRQAGENYTNGANKKPRASHSVCETSPTAELASRLLGGQWLGQRMLLGNWMDDFQGKAGTLRNNDIGEDFNSFRIEKSVLRSIKKAKIKKK